ncbi:Multidrug export protein EmrB [Jeotgalicoccus aerolatus]|uniref:EmrB/QacA subfamily drug resistance transporter n=1 Tax=Jeotgalicoccus aerolatus TaxID=709510 RepID=A0ABS4HLX0_9STAP|nr:MDR family MFS transporter [Jeotgalicoccus aerolatus]MBP1951931.1 EmrB/QacA subfamily drug resistance transporter [Jeotgalicoccus aerolatus]GGD93633.1 multidrug transporter [Jeotgalicoccus aerolatus]CAD2074857.1 Multidrug export protein EmrB [Jeotgalicoccus aerolatus]
MNTGEKKEGMTGRNLVIAILIVGAFVTILNQTLLVTAVPVIMADLNIPFSTAQWLTTGFFLVNGIMIPVSAFLINKFTTRKLYMTAMILFTIGTIIAAVSHVFPMLLAGRILQAGGAGIMMPLSQVILLQMFTVENRGKAMGLFGLIIGFAPAIGPTLSGYIVEFWPWRTLFIIIVPLAAINIVFAYFYMRNVTEQTNPKVDILSIIMSTLGFGGMLYGFSVAGVSGWTSLEVILPILAGLFIVLLFVRRQFKLVQPILEIRVLKNPYFLMASLIGIIIFVSMVSANNIVPVLMQDMLGFTAFQSGLSLLPGALVMGVISLIAGWLFDQYGIRILTFTSLILILGTSLMLSFLSADTTFTYITIVYTVRLAGVGLSMMALTTYAMNALDNHMIAHGTSLNNTMRQIGGSLFTALFITIMTGVAFNISGGVPDADAEITGVNWTFKVAAALAAIGLVLALFLKEQERVVSERD